MLALVFLLYYIINVAHVSADGHYSKIIHITFVLYKNE